MSLGSSHRYLLYREPCDMRKSFDGLCGLVRSELDKDPMNGEVFIFINKRRSMFKLLHWESGGFVLYYKRLERGTFSVPDLAEGDRVISWPGLVLMIEGIQIVKSRQKPRVEG